MSETIMPVAEANLPKESDLQSYEFAFHVLPTVTEGEVSGIFDNLKTHITKAGGEIFAEEAPLRFDLAYEIVKHLEGKNRKFSSAYFGWVRFRLAGEKLAGLTEELDATRELLRYLLIKLTKVEEQNPFRFHESIADRKVSTVVEDELAEEVVADLEEEIVVAEALLPDTIDDGEVVKKTV